MSRKQAVLADGVNSVVTCMGTLTVGTSDYVCDVPVEADA